MGGACCVAGRDKNIVVTSRSEAMTRNIRHSPTWSFRWENRGRVAGEEVSVGWFSDERSRSETKFNSTCASEDSSPKLHVSDHSRDPSLDAIAETVKTVESSSISLPSSSFLPSPISDETEPPHVVISKWHSLPSKPSRDLTPSSSFSVPSKAPWTADSRRCSHAGSSDGWSVQTFADLVAASRSESFSIDTDGESHVCGICKKLLSEKSLWSTLRLIAVNELSVVAVLICGHAYHAECLEILTPEINKYDPSCPICTLGEKQTFKLSQKTIKGEIEGNSRNRRVKPRVIDGDLVGSHSASSSSKPFLRSHFSFALPSQPSRKKSFFWSRSLKA